MQTRNPFVAGHIGNTAHIDSERLLHIYLADHLAGSSGGVALARRIAGENEGNDYGREMGAIAGAIEEDREALREIMERVGARERRWRQAGALLGERLARAKPNGALLSYSPLSRLLELEGMIMGVTGKLELWRSLRELARTDSRLSAAEIEALAGRAEEQRARLEELHARAAAELLVSATRTRPAS